MSILPTYQYGTHVKKGRPLYMISDKKIYFGEWLIAGRAPITIVEMEKQIAAHQASFYLKLNDHNNIIRTFGYVENDLNLTIFVQEYASKGDLWSCLMENEFNITQPILIEMFLQIANAMSYVASERIVHNDLACQNVLVFRIEPKNALVKITDFGLARWIDRPSTNEDPSTVPIRYCAPEILRNNSHSSYSEKSDVYSMGVLMWEALSNGEIPYSSDFDDNSVIQKKLNNERLPRPLVCDGQLWTVMNNCWEKDPKKRPTFDEIKKKLSSMKISEVLYDLITVKAHK
jgi:serine/threonine protein kinase